MIKAEDETRGMLLKTTWPSFAKEWREGRGIAEARKLVIGGLITFHYLRYSGDVSKKILNFRSS
jgi:hypothetical protein